MSSQTFDEAATIGALIWEIPAVHRRDIIIADGGSADESQAVARAAVARVIDAVRGYGRACAGGRGSAFRQLRDRLHGRRRRRPGRSNR